MGPLRQFADWLDSRTGFRAGRSHLLDEPLPAGTGWWFVTGSILLFLLGVQLITGVVLTMYYVPSPEHAYDSVRYITDQLPLGRIVRGLHFFGASFIVIAAVIHMLRVVLFGSYKKPREVTWMTGVVLLLLILGFALTGYLLPWDQKAYWATTVTINIARSTPLFGEQVASVLRGGVDLGALTLLRWYSAHVFLLPAALVGFVVAHVYLMRRHGISGPLKTVPGEGKAFFPYHALKDTIAMALVFAVLLTFAVSFRVPLDAVADPSDASYVPRPEWYFLSLFQLLKYFPGKLEPVATVVIPGLVVGGLLALPFLDRRPDRHPLKRPLVVARLRAARRGRGQPDVSRLQGFSGARGSVALGHPGDRRPRVRPGPALRGVPPHRRRGQSDGRHAARARRRMAAGARGRSRGHRARHPQAAAGRHVAVAGAGGRQLHAQAARRRRRS